MALQERDLIFPDAARNIHSTLGSLKRVHLSIPNRLHSIAADADFVKTVAAYYNLPLIANERCGSWYVNPSSKSASAYFKSTDGHFGQWSFNLRRLNLHILTTIGQHGGYVGILICARVYIHDSTSIRWGEPPVNETACSCIVVDSTRRGKSMPDALSKSVPIWIAVLNRLLFPSKQQEHQLLTPDGVVSLSEGAQISNLLPGFCSAASTLDLDADLLRSNLRHKPMRPFWVTPRELPQIAPDADYHMIILCTASSQDSERDRFPGYVQGAADDHESWGHGLDAVTFWRHKEQFLSTSQEDMYSLIDELRYQHLEPRAFHLPRFTSAGRHVAVATSECPLDSREDFDIIVYCGTDSISPALIPKSTTQKVVHTLHFACASGKVGSRQLRHELRKLAKLRDWLHVESKVLVLGPETKDITIGAALAVDCVYLDGRGNLLPSSSPERVLTKLCIKQRLSRIMIELPDATPSRATLQSVNAYVLGRNGPAPQMSSSNSDNFSHLDMYGPSSQ